MDGLKEATWAEKEVEALMTETAKQDIALTQHAIGKSVMVSYD